MVKKESGGIKPVRIAYKFLGLVFPISYLVLGKSFALFLVLLFIILYSLLDFARLKNKRVNGWIFNKLHFLVKDKERGRFSTSLILLLATFLVILLFQKEIAVISLFIFTVGDASANILGKRFHKIRMFNKSLEGHFFCFIFAFLAGFIVARFLGFSVFKVFVGALAATIIQVFPLKIDDNFTMPLAAAIVMSLI